MEKIFHGYRCTYFANKTKTKIVVQTIFWNQAFHMHDFPKKSKHNFVQNRSFQLLKQVSVHKDFIL